MIMYVVNLDFEMIKELELSLGDWVVIWNTRETLKYYKVKMILIYHFVSYHYRII